MNARADLVWGLPLHFKGDDAMLVTVAEFNTYTGNMEADTDIVALKTQILMSAQNIVADFLRFDPENHVWDEDPTKNICPDLIKLTVLKIATLQLMETGENIGVTSKSMPDNSRTFINLSDKGSYKTWLRPIQNYREVMF